MMRTLLWVLMSVALQLSNLNANSYFPVARVSDPPPAVDGNCERLSRLPGLQLINNPDNIIFGRQNWQNPDDLSAEIIVGYDLNYLYVGARVRDDIHKQEFFQKDIWKGDHVMICIDYPSTFRNPQMDKVLNIGVSPGNFKTSQPEVYIWQPANTSTQGIKFGAVKTDQGYNIEVAIPWSRIGAKPQAGTVFGLDVFVSDSDNDHQDTLLSLSGSKASPKAINPGRLLQAVLADANGKIDPVSIKTGETTKLSEVETINGESSKIFNIEDKLAARMQELIVNARIENAKWGGATYVMKVEFNGVVLDQAQVRNRDQKIALMNHIVTPCNNNNNWYIPYAPDFNAAKLPPFASGGEAINPFELRFDVSKLVKPAGNAVKITHAQKLPSLAPIKVQLAMSDTLSPKMELSAKLKDAPKGELPVIAPGANATNPEFSAKLSKTGALEVVNNGEKYLVESLYSTLTPAWATLGKESSREWEKLQVSNQTMEAQSKNFSLNRTMKFDNNHITVIDRISNLTSDLLPLMYKHQLPYGAKSKSFKIGGYPVTTNLYNTDAGVFPVALALNADSGIGIVAEDDLSRAQGEMFLQKDYIGVANNRLVLTPGRTVEIEYSIYPLERADDFLLINRIRQNWDVNFTIPGSEAIISAGTLKRMGKSKSKEFLDSKNANYAILALPMVQKKAIHGGAWFESDLSAVKDNAAIIRQIRPQTKIFVYYHCFISNGKDDLVKYKNDAMLLANGSVCDYGGGTYPIFLPAAGSPLAKLMEDVLDARYAIGIDNIFWDEVAYSMYKYDYNPGHWDNCSAQIDPKTHKIVRKITNVTLATLEWRLKIAGKIMQKGLLIGNGSPMTRTFGKLKFPRFIETGSITNIVLGQLYTPIALGDHLSEKTEFDAYRNMVKGLDYGAVYYWYSTQVDATHETLTSSMFPITPIELGMGYIIGRERILTNRSGRFTWGDECKIKSMVYNREGIPDSKFEIPVTTLNGKTYAEVRIPEGYSAALIRQ